MPWVKFEPTILVFERVKTVHASDRAATAIGVHKDMGGDKNKYQYKRREYNVAYRPVAKRWL
jgi:hypothetical protein